MVDHIDRNRANNKLSNLRCLTQSDNVSRTYDEASRKPWTANIKQRKLPADAARECYELNHAGMTFSAISDKLGMTRQQHQD